MDKIDDLIKGELPKDNPRLRQKIKKYMTHPYDHLSCETSRCHRGNRCIYGFPKPIIPDMYIDEDGRIHSRTCTTDDQWISSHIPELVNELDCHIFVDIVFTVTVFMYLYKYMFKGPDHSLFHVECSKDDAKNEIKDYVEGRYLSSVEATWRILGFHLTAKKPAVRALIIHLPGENLPQFLKEDSASALIRYFHRPDLPEFKHLTYIQYNQQYVFYRYHPDDILADDEYLETAIRAAAI